MGCWRKTIEGDQNSRAGSARAKLGNGQQGKSKWTMGLWYGISGVKSAVCGVTGGSTSSAQGAEARSFRLGNFCWVARYPESGTACGKKEPIPKIALGRSS